MAKIRRSTKRTIGIVLLLVILLGSSFAAFHLISTKQIKAKYEEDLKLAQRVVQENTKQVYVAAGDIKLGSTISAFDVVVSSAIVSLDDTQFFGASDIGAIALVDIPAGQVITTNMITYEPYEDTVRETEFDVLVLNSNLTNGDFVDVRIRYKNGEDYIVLTKKPVKHISLRNAICYLDLTEEETQLMASAIVDASLYGAVLYTNTYLEPSIQEASKVTYKPSKEALENIVNNPNILEIATKELSALAREEMEKRLAEYEEMLKDGNVPQGSLSNTGTSPTIDSAGNMQDVYLDTTNTDTASETETE